MMLYILSMIAEHIIMCAEGKREVTAYKDPGEPWWNGLKEISTM